MESDKNSQPPDRPSQFIATKSKENARRLSVIPSGDANQPNHYVNQIAPFAEPAARFKGLLPESNGARTTTANLFRFRRRGSSTVMKRRFFLRVVLSRHSVRTLKPQGFAPQCPWVARPP